MSKTFVTFDLRQNRLRVFTESLRSIGSPRRICLLLSTDGQKLLLAPYLKRDFKSHNVPESVYLGKGDMYVHSMKLCRLIAGKHGWDIHCSYRVPGEHHENRNIVTFDLNQAVPNAKKRRL